MSVILEDSGMYLVSYPKCYIPLERRMAVSIGRCWYSQEHPSPVTRPPSPPLFFLQLPMLEGFTRPQSRKIHRIHCVPPPLPSRARLPYGVAGHLPERFPGIHNTDQGEEEGSIPGWSAMGAPANGCKAARLLGTMGCQQCTGSLEGWVGAGPPGVQCLACKVQHRVRSNGL